MKNDNCESAHGLGRVDVNAHTDLLGRYFGRNRKRPVENVRGPSTGSGKIDKRRIVHADSALTSSHYRYVAERKSANSVDSWK
jgi:hypothetical protein